LTRPEHAHAGGEEIRLTFRAQPADVPWACRVRTPLKIAGRQLALKCQRVEDITPRWPPTLARDATEGGGATPGPSEPPGAA
jgi:hypothetical protein